MAKNSYKHIYEYVTAVAVIISLVAKFIQLVAERDRLLEFFISTSALIYSYYFLVHSFKATFPVLITPIFAYFIYWAIILTIPKKKQSSEIHRDDETWWWNLTGWDFEEEVAKVFRKHGYKAKVTKKTGDNGVDIIMYKNKKKIIVQCKHYRDNATPESVRALWGVKDSFKADEVYLVASSGVSKQSLNFIKSKYPYYSLYTLNDIINLACSF